METPALELLLTGYFHEDCFDDYGDDRGVVTAFMAGQPTLGPALVSEIDTVLLEVADDDALADFVRAFQCPSGPPPGEARTWLTQLRGYAAQAPDSR